MKALPVLSGLADPVHAGLCQRNLLLGAAVFAGTKIWKKVHPAVFLAFGAVMGIVLKL